MDVSVRRSRHRRDRAVPRPPVRLAPVLVVVVSLALLLLWPVAAAARPPGACGASAAPEAHCAASSARAYEDVTNSIDVVGDWGWSVGTQGMVVRWPRAGGDPDFWPIATTWDAQAVDMVTTRIGYLVAKSTVAGRNAAVFKTTNGGRTWKKKTTTRVDLLAAVRFKTRTLGWVAGRAGTILKTTDGGKTWVKQRSRTSQTLWALSFPTRAVGYAAGDNGVVLKTTNGGKRWRQPALPMGPQLFSIDFAGTKSGWVVGSGPSDGDAYSTTDGGKTWTPQGVLPPPLAAVDLVGPTRGWVIADDGTYPDFSGRIFRIDFDGSAWTWTEQTATVDPAPPDYGLFALKAKSATEAYAGGQHEASLYTEDGTIWHLAHIATP